MTTNFDTFRAHPQHRIQQIKDRLRDLQREIEQVRKRETNLERENQVLTAIIVNNNRRQEQSQSRLLGL